MEERPLAQPTVVGVLVDEALALGVDEDAALQAKALNRAIAGVESASRIIEAVLGFARADEELTPANVSRVIDATLACLGRAPERDGISLTVAERDAKGFVVAIIPETLRRTTLGHKSPGDRVNLETDILVKAVVQQTDLPEGNVDHRLMELLERSGFNT